MSKLKTFFVCQSCGYKNPRWLGRCPECNEFNTLAEEVERPAEAVRARPVLSDEAPIPITEVKPHERPRLPVQIPELDRTLGGGIVLGSVSLIGGDPGIGKSTLILQISNRLAQQGQKILYVSAEESVFQTKLRAERLGVMSPNLYIVSETNVDVVTRHIENVEPAVVIIDSIQMIYKPEIPSAPGMISQVRECATQLIYHCKRRAISLFIIGHVTKEGVIAGPKTLEHLVDAVYYFEGDRFQNFRLLRAVKNRFGATNEIGIFEMTASGLVEVPNPSELFISQDRRNLMGSAIVPAVIGTRTLLVEIQALTSKSGIGVPARRVTGAEFNRVAMILAVLDRRIGLHLGMDDVYVNIVGGVQIEEPAADLGIAVATASSFRSKAMDPKTAVFGELGLAGEIRGVTQANNRLQECKRLGFERAVVPKQSGRGLQEGIEGLKIFGVSNLREALEATGAI